MTTAPLCNIDQLVDLKTYRLQDRLSGGKPDALFPITIYAQDSLVYKTLSDGVSMVEADHACYLATPEAEKVNKFGKAYRDHAPLLLDARFADILVDAAIDQRERYGWITVAFDGLRTMEGGQAMADNKPAYVASGLLSKPGRSAHNRAFAVDVQPFFLPHAVKDYTLSDLREVDMGAHFDHINDELVESPLHYMKTIHRQYQGDGVGTQAQQNRLRREQAMQRAAAKHGRLIAPLREEFWDDRPPGSSKDLWRVLESVLRCVNARNDHEIMVLKATLQAEKSPSRHYQAFCGSWKKLLADAEETLQDTLGLRSPPALESFLFHESYANIFSRDLPSHWRQTDG